MSARKILFRCGYDRSMVTIGPEIYVYASDMEAAINKANEFARERAMSHVRSPEVIFAAAVASNEPCSINEVYFIATF